ncbi:MAG TPA: 1-deoxy-D-xylulose-5-phosphate synthase [Candidatus Dormibacteraeota bacterium]|nr:1-deoxy-D-xylulose-5-phosphate synthase [Candidatus Dormibacteraeota bacterium]
MAHLLDGIHSPADVKQLTFLQLEQLAAEIREELINVLAKNGGHLGPNLGVVELTIAMHYVFDTPKDHFVFDVSHQAYVHKLLTGRRGLFHTIRKSGGLSGFMLRTESEHDCYGAGHAGTALSAALGMAVARDKQGGSEHVVALAGDAAFTCGITYEALNNIAHHTEKLLVILNDNEWSIDKNVGAIAAYLNRIVTHPKFDALHGQAGKVVKLLGGQSAFRLAKKAEEAAKSILLPSVIFEELGLKYYGPIDGHDIPTLIHTLESLKRQKRPCLLHVLTTKGKGFEPAMQKQKKFHGLGPYDPETGETKPAGTPTYSEVFAETLIKLADRDPNIVAITAAMPNGTMLDRFQVKHPGKYFDVGIAEEHAVLFAAGLASKGLKPVVAIYSTFLQRAFDPIVHDVCLQNLPVVFCMDRGSLSGDDGPTHHGLFDISYLRGIPNIVHMVPKDEDELADMLYTATLHDGPIAIRYPRGAGMGVEMKPFPKAIPIGKAEILRYSENDRVAIFALGAMVPLAEEIAALLEEQEVDAAVINARFSKPLDSRTLEFFARNVDVILTLEDHVLMGGFGSAVLEELNNLGIQKPVERIGWPDQFIELGKPEQLRAKYGLTAAAALLKLRPYLQLPVARRIPIPFRAISR